MKTIKLLVLLLFFSSSAISQTIVKSDSGSVVTDYLYNVNTKQYDYRACDLDIRVDMKDSSLMTITITKDTLVLISDYMIITIDDGVINGWKAKSYFLSDAFNNLIMYKTNDKNFELYYGYLDLKGGYMNYYEGVLINEFYLGQLKIKIDEESRD